MKESSYLKLITVVSILIPLAVAMLYWLPAESSEGNKHLFRLPLFHAVLNGTTFFVLLLGYYFIRQKEILKHRTAMITAAAISIVFLVSYLVYHSSVPQAKYGGEGNIRYFYFTLLITHILLAAAIVPLVLITLYRGLTNNIKKHRAIARWTLPLWLYVALTGVIVYLMMSPYYPQ